MPKELGTVERGRDFGSLPSDPVCREMLQASVAAINSNSPTVKNGIIPNNTMMKRK